MRIDIVTVLPELLVSPLGHSILKRAQEKGLLEVVVHDLRPYGLGGITRSTIMHSAEGRAWS